RTFDASRDWQPFADVAGDLEQSLSAASISGEHDASALGPAITTALIGHQLTFDLRTILTTVTESVVDGNAVELQAGTALLSSIRLGGTARATTIGSESHRAFN